MNGVSPKKHLKNFIPYGLAAFLVGIVGGFTAVLGPAFVQDIGIPYNNTTWTALSLAVSSAVCAPIMGKLSDVMGRRATLLLGVGIFTLGNILTAIASSLLFMITARFVVGAGTAAIAPAVMSYIVTEFPPNAVAKGFSLYMLISSSAVIFGPSIGSFILEAWNWRIMMWICVVLSALFFLLCFLTHPKTDFRPAGKIAEKTKQFDYLGAVFIILFFSLMLCIPSFGQNLGWRSPQFLTVAVAAPFFLAGLFVTEKRTQNPVLPGNFIKRKAFILSVAILFLTQGLMQANMTNIIVFVNYTQPQNSIISGYAISIMYLGMSIGSIILGPLADRREPKNVLSFSLLLTALSCGIMLAFDTDASVMSLAASLGVLGFGLGANAAIFMKIVFFGLPADMAGAGTGAYGLFRDLAAPFGVAIFVPLFTNRVTALMESSQSALSAPEAAVDSIHMLAVIELCSVIAGIIIVRFLPKIHSGDSHDLIRHPKSKINKRKGENYETEK